MKNDICYKLFNFLSQFSIEKALFLNGMVYIFVHPNVDFIIAMSLENQQMKMYKSKNLSHVTELKTVIPYYS